MIIVYYEIAPALFCRKLTTALKPNASTFLPNFIFEKVPDF
jgi:hypothetical protein